MQFKFRILDLIVITGLIALLVGSFREDLMFFRRLFCVEMAALFSTLGVLVCFRFPKRAWLAGAVFGLLSGLVYAVLTFVFARYAYDQLDFFTVAVGKDPFYSVWIVDSAIALAAATLFGTAIGPMLALRLRAIRLPIEYSRAYKISIGILSAMLLLALLRMFDRLANFGNARDLTPLILIAFVVFIVYTNQWLFRFYKDSIQASDQTSGDPSKSISTN